ncbi:hypothetical protein [Usitatibacter palustris]|nr:hypothetical protein [Usitatibacter palustris]
MTVARRVITGWRQVVEPKKARKSPPPTPLPGQLVPAKPLLSS